MRMRLGKLRTPLVAINVELELREEQQDTKLSTAMTALPEVGEAGVMGPVSNAPVYPEPDQGNDQGEGQDQAEKLATSPPSCEKVS